MNVRMRISLIAIPILFFVLQAGLVFGGESRPGKFPKSVRSQSEKFLRMQISY